MKRLAVALAAALALGPAAARGAKPSVQPVKARIETGVLVGRQSGPVRSFKAIPYAAPPLGPLRWAPPAPARAWAGERDAGADGPACLQPVNADGRPNGGGYAGPTSEDCLTLDVWAPAQAHKAPVMVWIYGGGNLYGADSIAPNDGRAFARDGVVLVSMNYRLGALGFFAHPALTETAGLAEPLASYGIMDQIAALAWVKRNIAAFGGDPRNVTVFGESAGGADVLTLMATPSAHGLFQKATVQSAPAWERPPTLAEAEAAGLALTAWLGLPAHADVDKLRAIPAEKLVGAPGRFGPVVDRRLIFESIAEAFARGEAAPVPLIIGSNSWEASLLPPTESAAYLAAAPPSLRTAYPGEAAEPERLAQAMFTDATMGAPARWIAARASIRAPAWLYAFSYVRVARRGKIPGANHTSENPYVFDTQMIIPSYAAEIVDEDRKVAAFVHSCWVSFAKTGAPRCAAAGRRWPRYDPKTEALMEFAATPVIRTRYREPQLDAQERASPPPVGRGPAPAGP